MSVVIAVLCAVVALVLLMVLLQSRGALASTKEALSRSETDIKGVNTQIDRERTRAASLEADLLRIQEINTELEQGKANDRESIEHLSARMDDLQRQLEEALEARHVVDVELADQAQALTEAKVAIEQHEERAEVNNDLNLALTRQNEELQVQLLEAADQAAKRSVPSVPAVLVSDDGSGLDVPGFSPGMAWDLELVRSDRTWRYSVAANPVEDPSPFVNTENPLKLAIEIEALALREDVGAFIGIDWKAGNDIDPSVDPARAHLTLRLAQELLASAAREMSPSTLIVTSDADRGGVSLEVVGSDPDDVDFKIPPPPIASEWIGIDEHGGMIVTVRAPH